jgi:hypothetical protein
VFGALTERDDQLRGLIENSNRCSPPPASRDSELKQTFVALPTFSRESRTTLRRLDQFADNTNPLVTQLRPGGARAEPDAAGPGEARAGRQRAVHRPRQADHGVQDGLPGGEKTIRDLRPLLRQTDPALRQLIPILGFLGSTSAS